jgi:hypothetical protein
MEAILLSILVLSGYKMAFNLKPQLMDLGMGVILLSILVLSGYKITLKLLSQLGDKEMQGM